jgi:hypothetical protein
VRAVFAIRFPLIILFSLALFFFSFPFFRKSSFLLPPKLLHVRRFPSSPSLLLDRRQFHASLADADNEQTMTLGNSSTLLAWILRRERRSRRYGALAAWENWKDTTRMMRTRRASYGSFGKRTTMHKRCAAQQRKAQAQG